MSLVSRLSLLLTLTNVIVLNVTRLNLKDNTRDSASLKKKKKKVFAGPCLCALDFYVHYMTKSMWTPLSIYFRVLSV